MIVHLLGIINLVCLQYLSYPVEFLQIKSYIDVFPV